MMTVAVVSNIGDNGVNVIHPANLEKHKPLQIWPCLVMTLNFVTIA